MEKKEVLLRMMTRSYGVVQQNFEVFGAVDEGEVQVVQRLGGDGNAEVVARIDRVSNITQSDLKALHTSFSLHHSLDSSLDVLKSVKRGEKWRILLAVLRGNPAVYNWQRAIKREDKAAPVKVRVRE